MNNKDRTKNNGIALSCKGISKTYHDGTSLVHALNGINLEIKHGELMMIVGPSGCGKTTLISIMAGILDHDAGECIIFGNSFNKMTKKEKTIYRRDTIGFVFQSFNLLPTLTAAENVAIPLLIKGVNRRDAVDRSKKVLDSVGLGDKYRSLPANLSGGQQQRVAIARSLVHNPKLIVCDEPTSALDHETGHRVMEVFQYAVMAPDRVLVIVTHDSRIFGFADRIAKMDDGKVIEVKEKNQISKQ